MADLEKVPHLLVDAEQAATTGDLASADSLLRDIARIQEAELGPLHPDLANTLNNLAVVAEQAGRPDDAETFYRRAVAIAAASLPADHEMVAASRQNLEDFCRARGIPIEKPTVVSPVPVSATPEKPTVAAAALKTPTHDAAVPESTTREEAKRQEPKQEPKREASNQATPKRKDSKREKAKRDVPRPERAVATATPSATSSPTSPPTSAKALPPTTGTLSPLAKIAIGAVILIAVVALLMYRDSTPVEAPPMLMQTEEPTAPAAEPAPAATQNAPAQVPPPAPAPQRAEAAPRNNERASTAAATEQAAGPITLASAQLCQAFAARGSNWRCDEAGDAVKRGSLVLYTRVKSARGAAVVHRWYRGDTLKRSVTLRVSANPEEGYRTFSRYTVDAGNWRVEVSTSAGVVLHEQRFTVR